MADITNQQLLDSLTGQLSVITDAMVTKEDLKNELKNELKAYATKDDLKNALKAYATKQDFADFREEHLRQSVLLDEIGDNVKALAEAVSDTMLHKQQLVDHEERLTQVEAESKLTRSVLTLRQQLKSA